MMRGYDDARARPHRRTAAREELLDPFAHEPVLRDEVVRLLDGCRRILDGTAGGGGHAGALAGAGASVLALDKDPNAVEATRGALEGTGATVRRLDFADAATDAEVRAFAPDGILLDLGVSSPQLDDDARGFSFRPGVPLDMRMSVGGASAADWLRSAPETELAAAFVSGADEPRSRAAHLAREIVRRRANVPFATSDDLVNAIRAVLGPRSGPGDFARLFQAVRIAVNGELERLAGALPALLDVLATGGVLAVIAYHSGEDRIVKHQFREWARACVCPGDQPVCTCRGRALGTLLTRKAIAASEVEAAGNARARSARLRGFRKAE